MSTRPMALAIVVPDLRGGGAERVAARLACEIANRGLTVGLVLLGNDATLLHSVGSNVDVAILNAANGLQRLSKLRRWLACRRPDHVLVTPSHLGWLAALASTGLKCKVMVREASTLSVDLSRMAAAMRLSRMALDRILLRKATWISLSRQSADDLAALYPSQATNIRCVPNPVITEETWSAGRLACDAPTRPVDGPCTFLSVGRLEHQKGMDVVLRAFAQAQRHREDRLIIAGAGADLPALSALSDELEIAGQVSFLGFRSDVCDLMLNADVFVLASRWEGQPGALIEALACGMATVATRSPGGSAEVLENGRWGELVPVDDITALADAMTRARTSKRRQPDDAWRKRYSIDAATDQYLEAMGMLAPIGATT